MKFIGYFGAYMLYRVHSADILREQYEFKTKKETYFGVSIKEMEDLKRVL